MSVGYATIYGDMCGGYNPLKNVYKTTVFALCKWRNASYCAGLLGPAGQVVPENIIKKPPTAELCEGQTDEATLGSYEMLDTVLRHMIEELAGPGRAAAIATKELGYPVTAEYAERIAKLVWRAQYKRQQAAPGVVLTGRDWCHQQRVEYIWTKT